MRLPGDYFTCTVADEPLVVTRADDGAIHAFSNVCRHRAGPVARGAGHRKALMCGYHGWTYGLDGQAPRRRPSGTACAASRSRAEPARRSRVETWGPFLFVYLDPAAPPLAEVLGSIPAGDRATFRSTHMSLFKKIDYEVACNWKVYVDNYLEGYHIPIVHPELFKELDYRATGSRRPPTTPSSTRRSARRPRTRSTGATSPRAPSPRRSTTGSSRT